MGKLIKSIKSSIVTSVEGVARITTASVNTAVVLTEGLARPVANTLEVAGNYSEQMLIASSVSLTSARLIGQAELEATTSALKDPKLISSIKKAVSARILEDINDAYDIELVAPEPAPK